MTMSSKEWEDLAEKRRQVKGEPPARPVDDRQPSLQASLKSCVDQLRLIVISELAMWLYRLAPQGLEGEIWRDAIAKGASDTLVYMTRNIPKSKQEEWARRAMWR